MPRCSASCGWISSRSSWCQTTLSVRRVCAPTLYWRQDAAGGQKQREARSGPLVGRDIFGADELALAAHEAADMHDRRAERRLLVARPLHRAFAVEKVEGHAGEARRGLGDLVHDFGRMAVGPLQPHLLRKPLRHLPVGKAVLRRHHLADAVDAPLGVGEGSVLFEEGRARQEDMGIVGGLVEEEVVHDDAFHRCQAGGHVLRVGVGLQNVLALDIDALERAVDGGVQHVRDAQSGLVVELHAPERSHRWRGSRRPRCAGSPAARAGTNPCRRRPARCSGRAAGSRRRPAGRYCR